MRALNTWRCATNVNFFVDLTNSPPSSPSDGECIVGFRDLGTPSIGSTTRASTNPSALGCDNSPGPGFGRLRRFDLFFNDNIDWHTSVTTPDLNWANINMPIQGDLETTAVHEIGHAMLLLHTKNQQDVLLRPSIEGYKRSLSTNDISGGVHSVMFGSFVGTICANAPNSHVSITENCVLSDVNEVSRISNIDVFPNPANDIINIINDADVNRILSATFFDLLGDIVFHQDCVRSYCEVIDVSNLPSGLYILNLEVEGGHFLTKKIVVAR